MTESCRILRSRETLTLLRSLPLESQRGLQNPHQGIRSQREPQGAGLEHVRDPHL